MVAKQPLKQGEKILFGIVILFVILAVISYIALEAVRLTADKPIFETKTHFTFSAEGNAGSVLFRVAGRCTACHRAVRNGTNMGLLLDGIGSVRDKEWLYNFLVSPEEYYGYETFDHGDAPKEAAYVKAMPKEQLKKIAVFLSELKSEQGSSSAPMPPEGKSAFIDSMLSNFAPPHWREKYTDIRDKVKQGEVESEQ